MANVMSTYVKLVNLSEISFNEFKKLFPTTETNSCVNVEEHLSKLYEEDFEENGISINWMNENIGGKQFNITFHDGYHNEGKIQSEVEIFLENAWNLPEAYLIRLINHFTKIDSKIILYGTYVDEFYDPIGAFVYAKDNFVDVEELHPGVEIEHMENYDYREETYERLRELSVSLYQAYLERLEEESILQNSINGFTLELNFWDNSIINEKEGKKFIPFVTDMIQISINRVLQKHANLGINKETFPIYFENNILKLNTDFFNDFENRRAIQAFLTLGQSLPFTGMVNWNSVNFWGIPSQENTWEFEQIIELSKDFFLLINEINDGGIETLAEIKWQVSNLITKEKDDYKINITIDTKTKEIKANISITN